MNRLKIVVDTNIWVSMAIGSKQLTTQMASIFMNTSIDLFVSNELLDELVNTLSKPKLQRYLTKERTEIVFNLIKTKAKLVNVATDIRICRDAKDDFMINLALAASATYLITGDDDLLVLHPYHNIQIVKPAQFLEILTKQYNA
jgi:uncharacterized protein